jgi:hypothetical protein
VVVTRDKILRASAAIGEALADRLEFHAYRALCGLLEHLRSVNLRGRNIMHGLYRPHGPDGASREGPSPPVPPIVRLNLQRYCTLDYDRPRRPDSLGYRPLTVCAPRRRLPPSAFVRKFSTGRSHRILLLRLHPREARYHAARPRR